MKIPNRTVNVHDMKCLTSGAYLLTLDADEVFKPGQMISLSLEDKSINRLYSLCNPPGARWQILFTVVENGQITPGLSRLEVGDCVTVSEPFGSFLAPGGPQVWIANGTGIAPFRSFFKSGLRPEKLIQGGRGLETFYFSDEWQALDQNYKPCSSVFEAPGFYHGRLTGYIKETTWPGDFYYLLCGSAAMIVEVRDLLIQRGVSFEHIISEIYF